MSDFKKKYPDLFQKVRWPWGPTIARFTLLKEPPPANLIANVNIVPRESHRWVVLHHRDGSWDLPGGTLEESETFMETLQRELLEEAGAVLKSFFILGAWECTSLAAKPYLPHLPHPEFFRLVGVGEIEIIQPPTNPTGAEKILSVALLPLRAAVRRLEASGRKDLSDLYRLAAEISDQGYPYSFQQPN